MDFKQSQYKNLNKVMERAQIENAQRKKELIKQRKQLKQGSPEYKKIDAEIEKIKTISDGTKKTYMDTIKAVMRKMANDHGIIRFKQITPQMTKDLIKEKIALGESASNIKKTIHALNFFQLHAESTRVFKEGHINITDHEDIMKYTKKENVIKKSSDSHRLKATDDEAQQVIKEMYKRDPYLASIAQYQYLTGLRVSEAIRQKAQHVHEDKHEAIKAKGGLNNVIHTNHHTEEDKKFMNELKANPEKGTNRIFHRQQDAKGNYKSDEQIRRAVTRLASRSAKKLGIGGGGQTFTSHSFRGAFAFNRMVHYCKNKGVIDQLIEDKIREQPRLKEKYRKFEEKIKNKLKNPKERVIQDFEKVQFLISVDLSHSRQDILRYYIDTKTILKELDKY